MFDIAPDAENSPFAVPSPRNGAASENLAKLNRGRGSIEMKAKKSPEKQISPDKQNSG